MNSLRNSMVFLQESGPRNHFLEIQAHDIRLGAIQESMDPAQELWKSIRPLGARAPRVRARARAGRGGEGARARALGPYGPVVQGA